ncbi:hypothetical protein GCM10027456_32780 [Kineosporia babensis]
MPRLLPRSLPTLLLSLLLLASLCLLGGGPAAAAGSSDPNDLDGMGRATLDLPPAGASDADDVQQVVPLGSSGQECQVPDESSAQARSGVAKVCTRTTPIPASELKSSKGSDVGAAAVTCTPGSWTYDRFSSCLSGARVTYTLYDDKGAPLGTAVLTLNGSMNLNATSTAWSDTLTVTLTSTSARVPSLNVALNASCSSKCTTTTASPWVGARTLTLNQSASGTVRYSTTLTTGLSDETTTKYSLFVTQTGTIPIDPSADFTNPRVIRCDNIVSNNPGCVYPSITPRMTLSVATYGGAAMTYFWAQEVLIDGWGKDQPLRRLADTSIQDSNRYNTCENGVYVKDLVNVGANDSCDEFPFAATYEATGRTAVSCAEILPLKEDDGTWGIYWYLSKVPTGNERCVIGHVDSGSNSLAGTALSNFTQGQRLLDLDKYYLDITA